MLSTVFRSLSNKPFALPERLPNRIKEGLHFEQTTQQTKTTEGCKNQPVLHSSGCTSFDEVKTRNSLIYTDEFSGSTALPWFRCLYPIPIFLLDLHPISREDLSGATSQRHIGFLLSDIIVSCDIINKVCTTNPQYFYILFFLHLFS